MGIISLIFTVNANYVGPSAAISFTCEQMVNRYSIAFYGPKSGQVNDIIGGNYSAGHILVKSVSMAGLFAYAPRYDLVNTAPLTGVAITVSISSMIIFDRAGVQNQVASENVASCSSHVRQILSPTLHMFSDFLLTGIGPPRCAGRVDELCY